MITKNELVKLYYDFIEKYKTITYGKNKQRKLNLVEKWYNEQTVLFLEDQTKEDSIKILNEFLSYKAGTLELINKLEMTIQEHSEYMDKIEDFYYCTENIVDLNKLEIIVDRYFNLIDDNNYKKDYFNLFKEYKNLYKKLDTYYKSI